MRGFLAACLLACIIAIATNVPTSDMNYSINAQDERVEFILSKTVDGVPPNSNWEFEYVIGENTEYLTLNSAGDETYFYEYVGKTIRMSEHIKSNYIPYARAAQGTSALQQQSFTQTHIVIISEYTLGENYYIEFSNKYVPPRPLSVGGVLTPTNKLALLTPYLTLIGLVIAVTITMIVVQRRRKD